MGSLAAGRSGALLASGSASATSRVELLGSFLAELHEFSLSLTELIELVQGSHFSTNAEVQTLIALSVDGPQRPGVLARDAGVTAGGMTNLLDRLQTAGFVTRTRPCGGDRRSVTIELTAKGREVADRTAAAVRLSFSLAGRRIECWRDTFIEVGFDVGDSPVHAATPPMALDLIQQLMRIGSELHMHMSTEDTFGVDEPSPGAMLHLLWLAHTRPGLRPRDIARAERLSPAGTTDLIDRAERAGLIERVRSGDGDGRAVEVELTERGRRALETVIDAVGPTMQRLAHVIVPT